MSRDRVAAKTGRFITQTAIDLHRHPQSYGPTKKPFNEMRENLGYHKSQTARMIYLGAMIYLRRIYDMFHAMKSNFLKPFFSALFHLI